MRLGLDLTLTTDASGNIAINLGNNPASDSNWAAMAACFDEYRTLATVFEFKPYAVNGSILVFAPIVGVVDYDTAANLTGYTLASQYSSVKEVPGNKPLKIIALMSGSENSGFISTGSAVANTWIKIYSAGNTASTNIGRYMVTHYVQFRGKGI